MTANPWDGVERRAACQQRPRIAIIFDPVEWRRKIHGALGGADAPFVAAPIGTRTQEADAVRIEEQSKQPPTPGA